MRFVNLSNLQTPTAPWLIRRRELLPALPERAWQALTKEEDLVRWWCNDAEVKLHPGGVYRFSGRHSYPGSLTGASPARDGDFEILAAEEPTKLSFRWSLGSVLTTVTYELSGVLDSTELVVTQSAEAIPETWWGNISPDQDSVPNWWWFFLPALRTYLEKGRPDIRLDFDAFQGTGALRLDAAFSTFPWFIWHKLTDKAELTRWWETKVEIEPHEDGSYRLGFRSMGPRRILTWEEGKRLRHDWLWQDTHETEIEWNIAEAQDDVQVSVTDATPLTTNGTQHFSAIFWSALLLNLKQLSERGIRPRDHQIV